MVRSPRAFNAALYAFQFVVRYLARPQLVLLISRAYLTCDRHLCNNALETHQLTALPFVLRHVSGDWGDICAEDRQANADALHYGYRLMSVYELSKTERLWIITEADRSSTTLLLPEEY